LVGASAYEFGTKVKPGDSDVGRPLYPVPIGTTMSVWDIGGAPGYDETDAVYLHTGGSHVNANDVRLTTVGDYPAGTKVGFKDIDIGMPLINFPKFTINYLNLYGSSLYDLNDPVYLHQSGISMTLLNDVRLTDANSEKAGTQVHNFDPDFNKILGTGWSKGVFIRFFDANGNGVYDDSDDVYLNTPTGVPGVVSVNNVRLSRQVGSSNDNSKNMGGTENQNPPIIYKEPEPVEGSFPSSGGD
jgi:hypothetical protein